MKPMPIQPTCYELRVAGHLSPEWVDWFEGMSITLEQEETRLTGPVADQAALFGLLKKVRDLGLSLLAVHQVPPLEPAPVNQPTKEKE